jgi:NADH-quinone oxidoreductase subunit J
MHSIIFLILTFCYAACILILFNVDFLGLIFIVIYVGAIAILFLFIVMMINVKIDIIDRKFFNYLVLISGTFFFIQIFFFFNDIFDFGQSRLFEFQTNYDNFSNLDSLGQYLFINFLSCFLIAGIILLIAIIGAITLTLNYTSKRKNQLIFRQLSRSISLIRFID